MNALIDLMFAAAEAGRGALYNCLGSEAPQPADGAIGAGGHCSTRFDLAAEEAIVNCLKQHQRSCRILTEELGVVVVGDGHDTDPLFIVDPLDGTNNLRHGFPFAAISIAARLGKRTVAGIVRDVFRDETFCAVHGEGAWAWSANKRQRLSVTTTTDARNAFVTFIRPVTKWDYVAMQELFFGVKTGRIVVSAALEMAFVAAGRTDAFVDLAYAPEKKKGGVRLVDIAAGVLLVREAGGIVWGDRFEDLDATLDVKEQTNCIAASSKELLASLLALRDSKYG